MLSGVGRTDAPFSCASPIALSRRAITFRNSDAEFLNRKSSPRISPLWSCTRPFSVEVTSISSTRGQPSIEQSVEKCAQSGSHSQTPSAQTPWPEHVNVKSVVSTSEGQWLHSTPPKSSSAHGRSGQ